MTDLHIEGRLHRVRLRFSEKNEGLSPAFLTK
ncbi:MAG: hypothetical protein QOH21_3497 [Acidobacteriota bacterium]|jgi:hypothetical protein|nr:hypothetical protein [Acidobacteriota bacterium]